MAFRSENQQRQKPRMKHGFSRMNSRRVSSVIQPSELFASRAIFGAAILSRGFTQMLRMKAGFPCLIRVSSGFHPWLISSSQRVVSGNHFLSPGLFRWAVAIAMLVGLAGCGRPEHPEVGRVSGVVTLDGQPLAEATV